MLLKKLWLLFFWGAIVSAHSSFASSVGSPTKIRIGVAKSLAMGLVAVAEADGLFTKNGQEVEVVWTSSGKEANTLLFADKVDLAVAYDTVIVTNTLERRPQRIYSRTHFARNNTALIVRDGRGIDHPSKLKGRVLGVPEGTNAHFFLATLLEKHSLSFQSLKKVQFGSPDELLEQFKKGELDGVAIWQPHVSKMARLGFPTKVFQEDYYREHSFLFGRGATPQIDSTRVKGVLRALYESRKVIRANPSPSYAKILRMLGLTDVEELKEAWSNQVLDLNITHLMVGQVNWQRQVWARLLGYPNPERPLLAEFDLEPLREISPYLVTVEGGHTL